MKEMLLGKTKDEIAEIVKSFSLPTYTITQITDWIYKKKVTSVDSMTNLPRKVRELLIENYTLGVSAPVKVQTSSDGTKKYLFGTSTGKYIETAMIPEEDRITVCVSSQVGCKMGCLFCMTARQGFQGQLKSGEILNQLISIEESSAITNIVFMGMGEPFDNLEEVLRSINVLTSDWGFAMSPRRITVSTIGIIPGMITFLEQTKAHLAISLHTPFDDERQKLMPVQIAYPIRDVISALKNHDFERQRRVSFEYIIFDGLNDTPKHVRELARLLNGIRCRINLIRFHPVPGTPLKSSNDQIIQQFKDQLNQKGILTTIRASRGQDIYAACGLLSTKELTKS
jgi:23S rRNA (adenine2503-C2)-methyltransferase